jgi:GxxExxY protein
MRIEELNELSGIVVDECIRIHRELGPGLLESVYEIVLAGALERRGLIVDRQVPVDIHYDGMDFPAAFRIDLRVNNILLLEVKSVERLANVHAKPLLTYLRLTRSPLGLLLNFSGERMKDGIRRVIDDRSSGQNLCASAPL